MAYLVELDRPCETGCGRRAVVELRNRRNKTMGRYCRACGRDRLNHLREQERAEGPRRVEGSGDGERP